MKLLLCLFFLCHVCLSTEIDSISFSRFLGTWSILEILDRDGKRKYDGDLNVPYELSISYDNGNLSAKYTNRSYYEFDCAAMYVNSCSTMVIVDTTISASIFKLKLKDDNLNGISNTNYLLYKMVWQKTQFNWPVSKENADSLRKANANRIRNEVAGKKDRKLI